MTVCSARLSWRSPPRLSRCRAVCPDEAGIGRNPGEPREGGFGADPAWMRPGDEHLRGDDRADARLVEQLGCEHANVGEDLGFELAGLHCCRLDAPGEAAQHEPGRELVGAGGA